MPEYANTDEEVIMHAPFTVRDDTKRIHQEIANQTNDSINNNNILNEERSSFSPSTQQTTRKSKNLKNLNLNLNSLTNRVAVSSMDIPSPRQLEDNIHNIRLQSPSSSIPSPSSTPINRSPSLFRRVKTTSPSATQSSGHRRKRSTTLVLNIPSSSSLASSPSSTTTVTSTLNATDLQTPVQRTSLPVIPFEKPARVETSSSTSTCDSSTDSPASCVASYSSEIRSQTIMHSFSEPNPNDESYKIAYSNGPICVLEPNLYLYSEPTMKEVTGFQVIINVAQEIKDYSHEVEMYNNVSNDTIDYYFVPWTHASRLTTDFPKLTRIIDDAIKVNKKVLIHCQCGVSRSASLIMAYFMKISGIGYNEAYLNLKRIVPQISPNLSLIYELIEWGELLENETV